MPDIADPSVRWLKWYWMWSAFISPDNLHARSCLLVHGPRQLERFWKRWPRRARQVHSNQHVDQCMVICGIFIAFGEKERR